MGVGYLPQVVTLLSAAVFVVAIFKHLNLSPVLGYLFAGAALGQYDPNFINPDDLTLLAEIGVVFLLFAIGLELTLERLIAMRWHVFGFGSIQVFVTAFIISCAAMAFGLTVEQSVLIGGALALSSTAVVLRVIADSKAENTQVGRLALANLLLQDFAVVPLLVLVPLLAEPSGSILPTVGSALVKAFIAMTVIFLIGRLLFRPLFKLIASAQSNELFIATTLLIVLGSSLATEHMGLSLAMGAFIAGLMVAETQYQHRVEESIMPFKDLFMGLFFMTVGMTIDLETIYGQLALIIGLSIALIIGKALIIIAISKFFRFPWGSAIHSGLLLSQGGEFAFILFGMASHIDIAIISKEKAQILLLVVTFTMALTPALSLLGQWINRKLNEDADKEEDGGEAQFSDVADLNRHVVIVGFGRTGSMVARMLSAKKVSYVVVEADAKKAKIGRAQGFPVYHGDPSRVQTLESLCMDRAVAAIITIPEQIYMKKAVRAVHKKYPQLPIVARSNDLKQAGSLRKLGASVVVPEKFESGLQMAGSVLIMLGASDTDVSELKNEFRSGNYERVQDIKPMTEETHKIPTEESL